MLASGHDLVTGWLSPQLRHVTKGSCHTVRAATDSDPTGRPAPTDCQSAASVPDMGKVTSIWFYTHDPQSSLSTGTWNFQVMLSDNVSLSLRLVGVRKVAGKQDIVPHVWYSYCTRYPRMKSEKSISYQSLFDVCKTTTSDTMSVYADIDIIPDIEKHSSISGVRRWQRVSKLNIWPISKFVLFDIEYFIRYQARYWVAKSVKIEYQGQYQSYFIRYQINTSTTKVFLTISNKTSISDTISGTLSSMIYCFDL